MQGSERAKEKEWKEGSEIYAADGRRRMQVMQKYDKSHSAFRGMAGEGRHARIRSDEGFISKAGRRPILISRQKPTLSVSHAKTKELRFASSECAPKSTTIIEGQITSHVVLQIH